MTCKILDGEILDNKYRIMHDIIYYKYKIYMVLETQQKNRVIRIEHISPLVGHLGCLKTYREIRGRFS